MSQIEQIRIYLTTQYFAVVVCAWTLKMELKNMAAKVVSDNSIPRTTIIISSPRGQQAWRISKIVLEPQKGLSLLCNARRIGVSIAWTKMETCYGKKSTTEAPICASIWLQIYNVAKNRAMWLNSSWQDNLKAIYNLNPKLVNA